MEDEAIEFQVGRILSQRGLTLAIAESCTGGLICHWITNVPGASDYFLGGVVSYANRAKVERLGVRQGTLDRHGAVSEQTVIEMARGVRAAFGADLGLSVSGIAGPSGGTSEKPVGTVWTGLNAGGEQFARHRLWHGSREEIKAEAARGALQFLLDYLASLR